MSSPRLARRGGSVAVLDERIDDQLDMTSSRNGYLETERHHGRGSDDAFEDDALNDEMDVVDELGHALGIEPDAEAEVWTSADILRARDRGYWRLERRAADRDHA